MAGGRGAGKTCGPNLVGPGGPSSCHAAGWTQQELRRPTLHITLTQTIRVLQLAPPGQLPCSISTVIPTLPPGRAEAQSEMRL